MVTIRREYVPAPPGGPYVRPIFIKGEVMRLWNAFASLDSEVRDGAVTTAELEQLFRDEAGKATHALEVAYWEARSAKLEVGPPKT